MPKILLVDDNDEIRELMCRNLQRNGYQVVVATNGKEAKDLAVDELPDLVLMDMNMPIMDGWEATKNIKAIESLENIPIIALSAYSLDGDQERAIEDGCAFYHAKPVDFTLLLQQIENALETRYEEPSDGEADIV